MLLCRKGSPLLFLSHPVLGHEANLVNPSLTGMSAAPGDCCLDHRDVSASGGGQAEKGGAQIISR